MSKAKQLKHKRTMKKLERAKRFGYIDFGLMRVWYTDFKAIK